MTSRALVDFEPWPLDALRDRLCDGDLLWRLCRRKDEEDGQYAIRESLLEQAFVDVLSSHQGIEAATRKQRLANSLQLDSTGFFGTCEVDVTLAANGRLHLCEVKSSKVNYRRNDSVVGRGMGTWLEREGFPCKTLHEIEQDYIRLLHYPSVSPRIGSCLFLMVDAFERDPTLWVERLTNRDAFSRLMRSPWVRPLADQLTASSIVIPLDTERMKARMILCEVRASS